MHTQKMPSQVGSPQKRASGTRVEMDLPQLRRHRGLTQIQLASVADMDQSELSKAERRGDRRVSTLRRYVEALGGRLEITARFGSKSFILKGV